MDVFFKQPTKVFHIREISRLIKLTQPSVTLHLKELEKDNLILRSEEGLYGGYKSNRDSDSFKLLKEQNTIYELNRSGCIEFIYEKIMPQAVVLFGSAVKGEDIETSDIDLFIEAKEEEIDLNKFEKILKRKISLFFKEDFTKLSSELKNNIINGIKLRGFLKVF